ncbi:protein phosphatase CheZ [Azospirillum sp.]|uniref:protein phosphatase CheZ n=1 Tax=Azospirillum sp. TaxID=34012 RepID=UPI002D702AE9|nr:protein phosphatase CheZ [Azospirillum sp.]HYD65059.1 protein phosphatase CheZ [Azospirillum sp.]
MAESVQLPEDDYRQLEAFISRTPKGRAFLAEHARRSRTMGIDQVEALVDKLHTAWLRHEQAATAVHRIEVLRHELQDMSASIAQARREIASIRPKDDGSDRIATAANELDAIVLSTERASIEILNAAERMLEVTAGLRQAGAPAALCDTLDAEVTNIFTACSFQDLTGQRTTKVVNALRYIEQRIMAIMDIWSIDGVKASELVAEPVDARPDAHLLNGPTDSGVDQDEIDRLLNGAAPAAPAAPAGVKKDHKGKDEEGPSPLDQSSIDALFG